ncbi:MAG: GNAT family N-acetyltransferase [Raoultibacter sp.]
MNTRFELGNKEDAFAVRTAVFINEQGFKDEFDDVDELDSTIHLSAYLDESLAGCARTFPDPEHSERYIFGRLAVLPDYRKHGLGSKILKATEDAACDRGAKEIHLHAQCSVTPLYDSHGYTEYGAIDFDELVEHIWMNREL